MINPAAVVKIVSFKDKSGKKYLEANQNTNIMEVQLDSGELMDIVTLSNIKEYNNSLSEFLNFKTNSIMKSNEIKKASFDILSNIDKIDINDLNNRIQYYKANGVILNQANGLRKQLTDNEARNKAVEDIALELVTNKRKIKATSIIRIPIAIGDNNYNTSRFIMLKKDNNQNLNFSPNGLYSFAQTSNHIPIEISAIKNKEKRFTGYFKISTAKTITASQIKFLIKHSIRTVYKMLETNKKPFMLKILKPIGATNIPLEYVQISKEINKLEELNRAQKNGSLLNMDSYMRYIYLLESLLNLMENNKMYFKYFKASLPLVVDDKYIKKVVEVSGVAQKDFSPLQNLANSMVLLNYNTVNPNIKQNISNYIRQEINNFSNGINDMKIFTVIHFISPDIFDEIDTWGFPINNIDTSKMNLSFRDTMNIYNNIENIFMRN